MILYHICNHVLCFRNATYEIFVTLFNDKLLKISGSFSKISHQNMSINVDYNEL